MEPAIATGSLTVNRLVDPQSLAVGDIISFRRDQAEARVTHRIVAIREDGERRFFTVQGDANAAPDPGEMSFSTTVERVWVTIPYGGLVMSLPRSPLGILSLLIAPAAVLLALQVLGRRPKEPRSQDAAA